MGKGVGTISTAYTSRRGGSAARNYTVFLDSLSVLKQIDLQRIVGPDANQSVGHLHCFPGIRAGSEAFDFATLARRAADLLIEEICEVCPGLFSSLGEGTDLTNAYRAWLTYKLLQHDAAKLAAITNLPEIGSTECILVQTAAPSKAFEECAAVNGRATGVGPVRTISGLPPPQVALLARAEKWLGQQGSVRAKKLSGGIAFLVGTPAEAEWMSQIAEKWLSSLPVNMITKRKSPELTAYLEGRRNRRAYGIGSWNGFVHGCLTEREHRRVVEELAHFIERLSSDQYEHLRYHAPWMVKFFDSAVAAIGLSRYLRPQLVVGAMEKSLSGLVLSVLGPELGIRLFNIQHGNIGRQRVLDLVSFDLFGIWREETRQYLLRDGYSPNAWIQVLGHPPLPRVERHSEAIAMELSRWVGNRQVLTLFMQPPKPPYVSVSVLSTLLESLRSYVGKGEHAVLLVKPHPSNTPDEIEAWKVMMDKNDAIRFIAADRSAMNTALALSDVAVSLYSTALVDAVMAGCSAIAFDPNGQLDLLQLDLPDKVKIARSERELRVLVDNSASRRDIGGMQPDFLSEVDRAIERLLSDKRHAN